MTGHHKSGLILKADDDFPLQAVENALVGGTTGDIATMRHLAVRARDVGALAALLDALAGLDADATAIARGETDGVPSPVAHALSLIGVHGVDPHVALAIAPVMDDCSVVADLGPHPGAHVAWWEDQFIAWTPGIHEWSVGSSGLGFGSDGLLHINTVLPATVCGGLAGRPLSALAIHPMIQDGNVILSASTSMGATVVTLRHQREMSVRHH